MRWYDAVQECPGGVRILVEARPGAARAAFPDGYDPWRRRIGIAVKAPAEAGKANAEVCAQTARFFGAPRKDVTLVAGAGARQKAVQVLGVDRPTALAALEQGLS